MARTGCRSIRSTPDSELGFDRKGECREELGGARAVELFGAGEVEERLVDRQWFGERREPQHRGPPRASYLPIFRHVRSNHDRIRAASALSIGIADRTL